MTGLTSPADAARNYKFVESNIAAVSPETKILSANPNRVAILFSAASVVGFRTTAFTGSVTTQLAFQTASNRPNVILTFEQLGPYVQQEFHAAPTAGSINVGIVEVIYIPTS